MKYMIAYLIRGEAAHYHKNLSTELATVFTMRPVTDRVPPHLTLKAPFDARQIQDLEKILAKFASSHHPAQLLMEGFGNFDRRVLFLEIQPSKDAQKLIAEFYVELKKIPWMSFERTDVQTAQGRKLHATIAYGETRKLFDELWNYIKDEKPKFDFFLDSIAILERDHDKWRLHSEYQLQAQHKAETAPQTEAVSQG